MKPVSRPRQPCLASPDRYTTARLSPADTDWAGGGEGGGRGARFACPRSHPSVGAPLCPLPSVRTVLPPPPRGDQMAPPLADCRRRRILCLLPPAVPGAAALGRAHARPPGQRRGGVAGWVRRGRSGGVTHSASPDKVGHITTTPHHSTHCRRNTHRLIPTAPPALPLDPAPLSTAHTLGAPALTCCPS